MGEYILIYLHSSRKIHKTVRTLMFFKYQDLFFKKKCEVGPTSLFFSKQKKDRYFKKTGIKTPVFKRPGTEILVFTTGG